MNWLNFAKGFKTFAGGLVLVGGAAAGMVLGVIDPATGISMLGAGLTVWGIGGKTQDIAEQIEQWTKEKEIKIDVPK